jgi:hypothetical protein
MHNRFAICTVLTLMFFGWLVVKGQQPGAASTQSTHTGRFQLLFVPQIGLNSILGTAPDTALFRIDTETGEVATLAWEARAYPKGSMRAGQMLKGYYWSRDINETQQEAHARLETAVQANAK